MCAYPVPVPDNGITLEDENSPLPSGSEDRASPSVECQMASKDMSLEDRLQAAAKTKQPKAEDRLARLYKRENEICNGVIAT